MRAILNKIQDMCDEMFLYCFTGTFIAVKSEYFHNY